MSDYSDSSSDEEMAPPPKFMNRGRRASVSAEPMDPTKEMNQEKVVVPKSEEQRARIDAAVKRNFLFRNLDEEQHKEVVDAMFEKKVSDGTNIIVQGDDGDYLYVVEDGTFDVWVKKGDDEPKKVWNYVAGGSFGELALMYNAPRAATVTATSDSIVWSLDRTTFRRILMNSTFQKRRLYEKFLSDMPLLSSLEEYERHKIADALETVTFDNGEVIIREGDPGETFYLIEQGMVTIHHTEEDGTMINLNFLQNGGYFGELALINDAPRKATVTAKGKVKLGMLSKGAFDRLLGPVIPILQRNTNNYTLFGNYIKQSK